MIDARLVERLRRADRHGTGDQRTSGTTGEAKKEVPLFKPHKATVWMVGAPVGEIKGK